MNVFIHTHSLRLNTGEEALITRVVTEAGKIGHGFSFRLDATEARHMAEWEAGVRQEQPRYRSALDHPWEKAWLAGEPVLWQLEPGFARIRWITEQR